MPATNEGWLLRLVFATPSLKFILLKSSLFNPCLSQPQYIRVPETIEQQRLAEAQLPKVVRNIQRHLCRKDAPHVANEAQRVEVAVRRHIATVDAAEHARTAGLPLPSATAAPLELLHLLVILCKGRWAHVQLSAAPPLTGRLLAIYPRPDTAPVAAYRPRGIAP
jgi:hypothetical protein